MWFGVVMALSTLPFLALSFFGPGISPGTGSPHGATSFAMVASLALAAVVFLLLTALFLARVASSPSVWHRSWGTGAQVLPWGSVSMGVLSMGLAASATLRALAPSWHAAAALLMWIAWLPGTALAVAVPVTFARRARRGDAGRPTFAWGVAVLPLVIVATTGAWLGVLQGSAAVSAVLAVIAAAFFAVGALVSLVVFTLGYVRHWWHTALPLAVVPSAWVPLGLVGQSAASTQMQALNVDLVASDRVAGWVWRAAEVQGLLLLPLGAITLAWAGYTFVAGMFRGMPFTPAWWTPVYPLASVATGTRTLGSLLDVPVLGAVGWVSLAVLAVSAVIAAVGTVLALWVHRERWFDSLRMG